MSFIEIGCCGAYCGKCRELSGGNCKGCRLGYDGHQRDIKKARCKIKVCCFQKFGTRGTCADCSEFDHCKTIRSFHEKKHYKYKKYKETIEFIRDHGYDCFLRKAENWKRETGKL